MFVPARMRVWNQPRGPKKGEILENVRVRQNFENFRRYSYLLRADTSTVPASTQSLVPGCARMYVYVQYPLKGKRKELEE